MHTHAQATYIYRLHNFLRVVQSTGRSPASALFAAPGLPSTVLLDRVDLMPVSSGWLSGSPDLDEGW